MSNELVQVPVWTLATDEADIPAVLSDTALTPDRLAGLRRALAEFSETPLTTLEAHAAPESLDRSNGIHLHGVSPLAQQLSQLVKSTPKVVTDGGETLYRMVLPTKVAAQVAGGMVKPMASSTVAGGVHSALTNGSKIAAQASFVPVTAGKAAAAGAATGSATTAGVAAAGAGALTVAAPLVLLGLWITEIITVASKGYGGMPKNFVRIFGWGTSVLVIVVAVALSLVPWPHRSAINHELTREEELARENTQETQKGALL